MNDDTTFERDLRATLERLGREPAPERLVARVAEIPSRQPFAQRLEVRSGLSPRSIGSGLGLLAAVLAIAVIALIIRPGSGPGPILVGGSPSLAVVPSASP